MTVKPPKDAASNFLCTVKNTDGTIQKVPMQDSQFLDNTTQSFYLPNDHSHSGLFKGMRTIIQEHIKHGSHLPDCQGLSNPTPTFQLTQIHYPSLGIHRLIRPELRSSGRSRFPIHTLRAFIQTPLRQVCPSSYIVHLMQ